MRLSAAHHRFLWIDQGLIPAIVNLLIVGGIAWAMFGSQSTIPIFGTTSVVSELLATGFLLPFLTCLISGRIIRSQVRRGQLAPLAPEQFPRFGWYRHRSPVQGVLLGGIGVLFGAATIPIVLVQWPGETMDAGTFIRFKAIWGALFGLGISPLIGWWALANATLRLTGNPPNAETPATNA